MRITEQAVATVQERMVTYGHPVVNHSCTADLWGAYLSRRLRMHVVVDGEDVCWMNVLQKISREANERNEDSLVDVIGFAINIAMQRDA